ncbi:TetR/AcrR family transcriptional regulator [Treponema pectinovorum]|uniref:TetR/AcrR family transcriptional regulator n=1 Tax=Treponema pectinovorum TaxID=164 RepID=UPI0011F13F65|nr:TetR/AcrR family transcriptional regulator [Treponema pectinovorum]
MAIKKSSTGKTTKELILEAAFSFYEKPLFKDFSMSQLALKVGITKAAIYRHFVNKESVSIEMRKKFFDVLAENILKIQESDESEKHVIFRLQLLGFITFFAKNKQYINYYIRHFSQEENFGQITRNELLSRGVKDEFEEFYKNLNPDNDKKIKSYAHCFYWGLSVLFFIKARDRFFTQTNYKIPLNDFSFKLINFLYRGFKGSVNKESVLYPVEISENRMKELDKICSVIPSDLPLEEKIFTAFAEVIKKYGVNKVTVERIAEELNMAKSSLYFYFKNKNEMIYSLLSKELNLLQVICDENISEAKNYSEFIYISMRTELSYFLSRPSTLPICGWLLQSGTESPFHDEESEGAINKWQSKLEDELKKIDLGFPLLPKYLNFWIGFLPVLLVVLQTKHNLSEAETVEALKYMFKFVMYGADF